MRFEAGFVKQLGGLARLELSDTSAERLAGELSRILAYVEELSDIDADAGDATGATPRREDTPLRTDFEPILRESAGRNRHFVEVPSVKEES